jgi:hypothetical protein
VRTFIRRVKESQYKLGAGVLLFPLAALALSTFLSFFLSSYLGIRLSETLIFIVEDGWCDTNFQGIGLHCFGDFSSFMINDMKSPWIDSETAYPPFSIILMGLFKRIYEITNQNNFALLSYLFVLLACLILPAYSFIKNGISKQMTISIFTFFILLAPSLMIIDRGNNIGFSVPLIFGAYVVALQGKYRLFQILIIFLTLLKPQFALLGIYLLFANQRKVFFSFLINSTIAYMFFFLFFGPKLVFDNVKNWLQNLFGYQSYVDLPGVFPANLSFANLTALGMTAISKIVPTSQTIVEKIVSNSGFYTILSLTFLVLILVGIYFTRNSLNDVEVITILLITLVMVPTVSFAYYLAVLLPFLYLLVYCAISGELKAAPIRKTLSTKLIAQFEQILATRHQRILFNALFVTCFINWPIPWGLFGLSSSNLASLLSIVWVMSSLFLFLYILCLFFGNKRLGDYSDPLIRNSRSMSSFFNLINPRIK